MSHRFDSSIVGIFIEYAYEYALIVISKPLGLESFEIRGLLCSIQCVGDQRSKIGGKGSHGQNL